MDKFANFLTEAANNPQMLQQITGLLSNVSAGGTSASAAGKLQAGTVSRPAAVKRAGKTAAKPAAASADPLFSGLADIASQFGLDLSPNDVAKAQKTAQARHADANDSFNLDDLAGLAGQFLGGGNAGNSGSAGSGLDLGDLANLAGSLLGGGGGGTGNSSGGFNPLDLLIALLGRR